MNTAQAINGEVQVGDLVIVAPDDDYGGLVGTVIEITKLGTPEHEAEAANDTDNIHVDFTIFEYPPDRIAEIEEHFSDLYGGPRQFDELPLDDVIIAPDVTISITSLSEGYVQDLVNDHYTAENFCSKVLLGLDVRREEQLMLRVDKNLADYHKSLLGFGHQELIDMAGMISAMSDTHYYLTAHHSFSNSEVDYLLKFESPLEVVADIWCARNEDISDMSFVMDVLSDKQDALNIYPLMQNAAEPAPETLMNAAPSPQDQLYDKMSTEYDVFLEELKTKPPGKILDAAYEKVFKEDILMIFESGEFSNEQISALLALEEPLESLYRDWLDSDANYMDILRDCIDSAADFYIAEQQKAQYEEIVQAVRTLDYGMTAEDFESSMTALLPEGTAAAMSGWVRFAEDLQMDSGEFTAKALAEYYVEFGLIKQSLGDELAVRLFNLGESYTPNPFEMRWAAGLLQQNYEPAEVEEIITDGEFSTDISGDIAFGKALIAFTEQQKEAVNGLTEHAAEASFSAQPLPGSKRSIADRIADGNEKVKAYKEQQAQKPVNTTKNKEEQL